MFHSIRTDPAVRGLPKALLRRSCLRVCSCLALCFSTAAGATEPTAVEPIQSLVVATTQYPIEGNQDVRSILEKCDTFVREATDQAAQLVVFPELVTLDAWPVAAVAGTEEPQATDNDREIVRNIAAHVAPAVLAGMQSLSHQHDIMILSGSSPRLSDGRLFNTSVLIFPDGRQLQQDKLNLTKWEVEAGFSPGTHLNVGSTPWGHTAILICYDVEFPDISAQLMTQRPTMILVPSMTESAAGLERVRSCAQTRAVEHHAFVIVSGTVGTTLPDWQHHGQSAVITPRSPMFTAPVLSGKRNERDLVVSKLDFLKLASSRDTADIYPSRDAAKRKTPIRITTTELELLPDP